MGWQSNPCFQFIETKTTTHENVDYLSNLVKLWGGAGDRIKYLLQWELWNHPFYSREINLLFHYFELTGIRMFQKNINEMQTSANYTQHKTFLCLLINKDIPYYPQESNSWGILSFYRRNKNQKQKTSWSCCGDEENTPAWKRQGKPQLSSLNLLIFFFPFTSWLKTRNTKKLLATKSPLFLMMNH